MFAIIKQEDSWIAKEATHYSKISDDIDVQLSKNVAVVLVMNVEDVAQVGIDPEVVVMDGEPIVKEPAKEEAPK